MEHTKDSDCTVVEGSCTGCGVEHGPACPLCGGKGFHAQGCGIAHPKLTEQDSKDFFAGRL